MNITIGEVIKMIKDRRANLDKTWRDISDRLDLETNKGKDEALAELQIALQKMETADGKEQDD